MYTKSMMSFPHSLKFLYLSLVFLITVSCRNSSIETQSRDEITERPIDSIEIKRLIIELNQVYDNDQEVRKLAMMAINEHGMRSEQVKTLGLEMDQMDSVNQKTVKAIIDQYGWLGSDIVGTKGNSALFLVIQHSDDETREAVLPILREALRNGSASAQDLSKLEDRVAISKGDKQVYGTQIGFDEKTNKYYLLPLTDPDNVDERREKMGLIPISLYLSEWQIDWDPSQF